MANRIENARRAINLPRNIPRNQRALNTMTRGEEKAFGNPNTKGAKAEERKARKKMEMKKKLDIASGSISYRRDYPEAEDFSSENKEILHEINRSVCAFLQEMAEPITIVDFT